MKKTTFLLFCALSFSFGSDCPDFAWKPILYGLQIDTDIYKNESSFRGEVVIQGVATKKTDTLVLHSGVNLTQALYTIDGLSFQPLISENDTILTLTLNEILNPGQNFNLTFKFDVSQKPKKLNLSYHKQNGTLRPVFATDFEPSEARFVFPCLDIPKYKAYFDLKLARPVYMKALSNMPLLSTSEPDPEVENQVWDTFYTSKHPMSTYVFAFVIFDRYQKIKIDDTKSIWHPENMSPSMFKLANKTIPMIFKLFEDYTGIEYDLPKFDLFLPPKRNYPAMENWGLVFYSKEHFIGMYDTATLVEYLAHEIGHQWFGNLVTCKYWCYSWINEGLNTYMTHIIFNKLLPSAKTMEMLIGKKYTHKWDSVMLTEWDSPQILSNMTQCCHQHGEQFGFTIYSKGALLMHMVASTIMDDVSFKKGIRQFLNQNAYGNVSGFELWNALEDQIEPLPESLANIMKTWTHNLGFPILNVYRFQNGSIALEQMSKSNITDQFWWIPLTFTTSKTKDFSDLRTKFWMKPNSGKQFLDIKVDDDEWILFNLQSSGYYEVNYDEQTWRLLVDNLLRSHNDIHPYNRADLIIMANKNDAKKSINFTNLLDIFSYLKDEEETLPLLYGLNGMDEFLFQIMNRNYSEKFREFYCDVLNSRYRYINSKRFQMNDLSRRNYAEIILENECSVVDGGMSATLESTVKSILDDPNSHPLVSPTTFWCRAMLSGEDQRVADFVKQKYKEENDCEYSKYLCALCCAQKQKYVNNVLKEIMLNDSSNLICLIQSCPQYEDAQTCFVVNFIIENYDRMMRNETFNKTLTNLLEFQSYTCFQKFFKWAEANNIPIKKRGDYLDDSDIIINDWLDHRKYMMVENVVENDDFKPNPSLHLKQSDQDLLKIV